MPSLGELSVRLVADFKQFAAGFTTAKGEMASFKLATDGLGSQVKKLAGPLVALGGAAAGLSAIRGSVNAFAEFEATMTRVGGVSRSLGTAAFDDLKASGREMAASTEFTASEVGEAMKFLAMSGQSANLVMASTPAVLQLASAAMMDVAKAADISTNVMTGYGLAANELGRANDVLFTTTTNSNTSMEQLGAAFKFVGPVAKSAGQSFEDTAAAIGVLGNAGIQGEMAGTALRGIMTKLLNPSKQAAKTIKALGINVVDSAGKMKPFREVVEQVGKSGATTGQLMAIFGQRAGPAMAALVSQGTDALDKLGTAIEGGAGSAAKMAEANINTLQGQMKILGSVTEETKIVFGEGFAPILKDVLIPALSSTIQFVGYLGKAISFMTDDVESAMDVMADGVQTRAKLINEAQVKILDVRRQMARGEITKDVGEAKIANFEKSIKRWKGEIVGVKKEMDGVGNKAQMAATDTGALAAEAEKAAERAERAAKAFEKMQKNVRKALGAFGAQTIKLELAAGASGPAQGAARELIREFDTLAEKARSVFKGDDLQEKLQSLGDNANSQAQLLLDSATTFHDWDRAMRELSQAGLLTAEDILTLRQSVNTAQFKTGQAKKANTDAGAAFAALTPEKFAEMLKGGADFKAATEGAAAEAAAEGARESAIAIREAQDAQAAHLSSLLGGLEGMALDALSNLGSAIVESFSMAFDDVSNLFAGAGSETFGGLKDSFGPLAGVVSSLVPVIAIAVASFASLSFIGPVGWAIQAGTLLLAAGITQAAALVAGFGLLVGILGGFIGAIVLGLNAIFIPVITAVAGFTYVVTNAAAALVLLPVTVAALTSAFAFLVTRTESFARVGEAFEAAMLPLVDAAEPFGENMLALAGLAAQVAAAFVPFVESVAGSEAMMRLVFEASKLLAAGFIDFVGVTFGLVDALTLVMQGMLGTFRFFADGVVGLVDWLFGLFGGSADAYTADITALTTAAQVASDALEDIRPSAEQRDALAAAKADMLATTFDDARRSGEGLASAAEAVDEQFQGLSSSSAGVVEGFNYERYRFAAAQGDFGPGGGGSPGFAGGAPGATYITTGAVTVVSSDPKRVGEEIEEEARRNTFLRTGSISPDAKGFAARTVG